MIIWLIIFYLCIPSYLSLPTFLFPHGYFDSNKMKPFDNIYLNMLAQSNLEYGGVTLEELKKLETNRKIVDRPLTLERNRVEDDPQLDKKETDRHGTESSAELMATEFSRANSTTIPSSKVLESKNITADSKKEIIKIPPSPFHTIRRKEAKWQSASESDEATSNNVNPFEDIATRSPPKSATMFRRLRKKINRKKKERRSRKEFSTRDDIVDPERKMRTKFRRKKTKVENEELSLRRPTDSSQERPRIETSDLNGDKEKNREIIGHQRRSQKALSDESVETDLTISVPPPILIPNEEPKIYRHPDNPFRHYDITKPTVISLPLPPLSEEQFER